MARTILPYSRVRLSPCVLLAYISIALIAVMGSAASFSANTTGSSTIGYTVKVLTSAGLPEGYNTSSGFVQWHTGLPVPTSDAIQVAATVATGSDTIKDVAVTVDGKIFQASVTSPWIITFSAGSLPLGDHLIAVTTVLNHHNATATLPLDINIVSAMPKDFLPPTPTPVVASVKGTQELLSTGTVANIDPTTSAALPPVVGPGAQLTSGPGVNINFTDDTAESERKAGYEVTVNGQLTVLVTPAQGSVDKNFVFSIFRDGNVVYNSSSLTPVAGTGINLQAKSGDTPGLNAGTVQLYVWGVDQAGNYSAPVVVSFTIVPAPPVLTKP